MDSKIVPLRAGVKVGETRHSEAELSLASVRAIIGAGQRSIVTVGDVNLPVEPTREEMEGRLIAARLVRLGGLKKPGQAIVDQLAADDFDRLVTAAQEMDRAAAAWSPDTPNGDEGADGQAGR